MDTTEHGVARRTGLAIGLAAGAAALVGRAEAAETKGGIKVTALYNAPKDPAAFEAYYASTHMPKVYAVKGIARVELAKPLPGPDGKPPAFYRITELYFDSMPAMQAVMKLPEWQGIIDDVPKFASGGATVLVSTIE